MTITELKKLAEQATHGPWQVINYDSDGSNPYNRICEFDYCGDVYAKTKVNFPDETKVNAKYIAAANPRTILSLIQRLEDAELVLSQIEPVSTNGVEYWWSRLCREYFKKWEGLK